jgi:quinol monooxygenase YgiN
MHFTEAGCTEFLQIFDKHKNQIRNFPGCHHLQLLKDLRDSQCFTTLSYWDNEASLDAYRQSPLFEGVWTQVKPLFAARTQAFSLVSFVDLS